MNFSEGGSRRPSAYKMQSQLSVPAGMRLSADEVDAMMENFAKEDNIRAKTWTRLIVENFLSKYSWYFPMKNRTNGPSLSKAYAYYEHITLPRHFVGDQTADHVKRRAEPGETQDTELYNPVTTPSSCFIEWGIGVDLYFSTVRLMAIILLVAGLISIPNIVFYRSEDYDPNQQEGTPFSLRGSAVCTTGEWVECDGCRKDQFDSEEERTRFAVATDGSNTTFVLRNACEGGNLEQGMDNWATMLFLGVVMALVSLYLKARGVRFDEDKLTSTDYSVVVRNPPKDAYDPDLWRDFFDQFSQKQVTAVTVTLNNELLLRKLVARRIHRDNLRRMLPKGTDMDDEDVVRSAVAQLIQERDSEPQGCLMCLLECTVFPILRIFNMFLKAETLVDRVFTLTGEIKELQKEKYDVSQVFVTFETEEGQRAALAGLAAGKIDIMMNNKANVAPSAIFQDRVLKVVEPAEPSAVRWLDLSASYTKKIVARIISLAVTIGIVSLSGLCVARVRDSLGPRFSAPLISIFNSIIPQLVKLMMIFEPHATEGSFQTSLYLKITLFRWVNTAVLTKMITPFTSTVSAGNQAVLRTINAILWSELWLVPGLRLLDLWGNVRKHILAPRSRNQELMNMNFTGTFYNLGERYTDLTKVLFVCFFYSALYPATFFFGAAILTVQYYTDKFCLMRIWAWSPSIGSELATFSRRYFFSGAVVAFALVGAYAWAQFPYDNLCDPVNAREVTPDEYPVLIDGIPANITVNQTTAVEYCSQSWREVSGLSFPPTERIQPEGLKWMSDSQETLSNIYGWTAVGIVAGFVVIFFGDAIKNFCMSWFRGVSQPRGQVQAIDFSCNTEIFAYVPQIKLKSFPFPFIACNVDHIDQNLIGWNDPSHSYDYHNLIFDVPWEDMPRAKVIEGNTRDTMNITDQQEYAEYTNLRITDSETSIRFPVPKRPIFPLIRHYPPQWVRDLRKNETQADI